jgi:hypothetical protein
MILSKLDEFIVKNLLKDPAKLAKAMCEIPTSPNGYVELDNGGSINLVNEIKRVTGLRYEFRRTCNPSSSSTMVIVEDEVGRIIKLYISTSGFAELSLAEFITETRGIEANE